MLTKVTAGFLNQNYDEEGNLVSQSLTLSDEESWENDMGDEVCIEDYDAEFPPVDAELVQPRDEESHGRALHELASYCSNDARRAVAYSRMAHLLTAEQLRDVLTYVEDFAD